MHIGIGKVETPDEMLDVAFRKARNITSKSRGILRTKGHNRFVKSRASELTKISAAADVLIGKLETINSSFPSLNALAPFYQELVRCTIDQDYYKQSLGAANWAAQQLKKLVRSSRSRMREAKVLEQMTGHRDAFYGRAASVLKQIRKNLDYLDECRRTFREFPSIKTSLPTVVIAGYPNVGKSTLLSKLTTAKPQIAPYPFTTKQLMLGYADNIQFIDTPGLLDRPLVKRNKIEKQAALALRHLATIVLFVVDPSESCGYTLDVQADLLAQLREEFKNPFLIVTTKMDLVTPEQEKAADKALGKHVAVDITSPKSVANLLSAISEFGRAAQKRS
jgi:nucleolar GTP-binding protein